MPTAIIAATMITTSPAAIAGAIQVFDRQVFDRQVFDRQVFDSDRLAAVACGVSVSCDSALCGAAPTFPLRAFSWRALPFAVAFGCLRVNLASSQLWVSLEGDGRYHTPKWRSAHKSRSPFWIGVA
jgi:hypothetical protein